MSFNLALTQIPDDKFNFLLKNGKRSSVLNGYDFESLIYCSFEFLKEKLPTLIKSGNFEKLIFEAFTDRGIGLFLCDVNRFNYNDILYFIFWIKDELDLIAKMEIEYLSSDPDIDMISAGINKLNQFGDLNIIDSLAGGDILKWQQIKKLPYSQIFDKQYKSVIEGDIQKKLAKKK